MTGLVLLLSACDQPEILPPRTVDHPLVFIGLDGAEWGVIEPMLARGELPNLQKLMNQGVHGGLINPGAMVSPPVWTTFVTGEHPRVHGILDHVFPFDLSSSKQPVDSTLRLSPALWNIASAAGLRSAVMGYFVSWPAEDIMGTIVTDRVMQKYPHSVFPEAREDEVFKIVSELTDKDAQEDFLRRYYSWGYRPQQADDPADTHYKAARLIARRGDRLLVNDEIIRRSAMQLQTDAYDLVLVYLRSTDLVSHSFWKEYDDSGFPEPADPELKEQLGDVIPESYRYVDEAIGGLMEKFGAEANYVVVSDHGFHSAGKEIHLQNEVHSVLTGNHLPVGIFIAAGPDIRTQSLLPEQWQITALDVLPVLMKLSGLPILKQQPAGRLDWLFADSFLSKPRARPVKAYPADDFARAYNSAAQVDQLKEMSSLSGLGYIGGNTSAGSSDLEKYDFWNSSNEVILQHSSGEIVDDMLNNKFYGAAVAYLECLQFNPALQKPLLTRVRIRIRALAESPYLDKPLEAKKLMRKLRQAISNREKAMAGKTS